MRKSLRTRAPQPEDETFTKLCGTLNRSIGQTSIHSYSTEDGHDLIDLQSFYLLHCDRCIDFDSFYHCDICLWNCCDSGVIFFSNT